MEEYNIYEIADDEKSFVKENIIAFLDEKFSHLKTRDDILNYFKNRDVKGLYDLRGDVSVKDIIDAMPYMWQIYNTYDGGAYNYIMEAGKKLLSNIYMVPLGIEYDLKDDLSGFPVYSYDELVKVNQAFHLVFQRGHVLEILALYYHETKDAAVVIKFNEMLKKFFEVYNLIVEEKGASSAWFQYSHNRESMDVGWLIISYICILYTDICYCEHVDKDLILEMIKRIYFLGIQFHRYDTDGFAYHNHHFFERGIVPYFVAKTMPEFPMLKNMEKRGKEVIREHIEKDFSINGKMSEHSIGYTYSATIGEMLSKPLIISYKHNDKLLPEYLKKNIEKIFDISAKIAPPHKYYTVIGDQGNIPVKAQLKMGRDLLSSEICKEVLEKRENEEEISYAYSENMNDAGFVVLRNGYGDKSNFLLMSALSDVIGSSHDHVDMLSIVLSIKGESFIDEPYANMIYKKFKMGKNPRGFLYNQTSHNVVLVHGKPIVDDCYFDDEWYVAKPDVKVEKFLKDDKSASVMASHRGYIFCEVRRSINMDDKEIIIEDSVFPGTRDGVSHVSRLFLSKGVTVEKISENKLILEKNNVKVQMTLEGDFKKVNLYMPDNLDEIIDKNDLNYILDIEFNKTKINPQDILTKLIIKIKII